MTTVPLEIYRHAADSDSDRRGCAPSLPGQRDARLGTVRTRIDRLDHRLGVENDKICHSRHQDGDHGAV